MSSAWLVVDLVLIALALPALGAATYLAILAIAARRADTQTRGSSPHPRPFPRTAGEGSSRADQGRVTSIGVPAPFPRAAGEGLGMGAVRMLATALPPSAAVLAFDFVVPAHDEEAGIAATVASLLAVEYPAERRRVIVVADNCHDATAERARAAGATVLVRDDPTRLGKGYALELAFAWIEASGTASVADAVVVVDADTLVSPGLLRAFAGEFACGAQAVQGEYGVRNVDDSWRTRLMAIALALFHGLRSLGRERLGLSVGLRGNGMAFRRALLRDVPYRAYSLVEDVEYGIALGEAGVRVAYAPEAKVFGEMVAGERASRSQRRRWEAGRKALARTAAPRLLGRALRRRDAVLLDLALDLLVPPLSNLVAFACAGLALALLRCVLRPASISSGYPPSLAALALVLFALTCLELALYVMRGLVLSRTGLRGLAALAWAPVYVIWKLWLALRGAGSDARGWVRTARARERSHDDTRDGPAGPGPRLAGGSRS
jgi:cellulose synthase/poly-beta-1,6-N-acetylglucosamine synthase-like glycosyltransferase